MTNLMTLPKRPPPRSQSQGQQAKRAELRLAADAAAAPLDFASAMRQVEREVYDLS
jgi:hypothetical protein